MPWDGPPGAGRSTGHQPLAMRFTSLASPVASPGACRQAAPLGEIRCKWPGSPAVDGAAVLIRAQRSWADTVSAMSTEADQEFAGQFANRCAAACLYFRGADGEACLHAGAPCPHLIHSSPSAACPGLLDSFFDTIDEEAVSGCRDQTKCTPGHLLSKSRCSPPQTTQDLPLRSTRLRNSSLRSVASAQRTRAGSGSTS